MPPEPAPGAPRVSPPAAVSVLLALLGLFGACTDVPERTPGPSAGAATTAPSTAADLTAEEAEVWAWDLVAPADGRTGGRDAIVRRWLDRVAAHPEHPLAEATLQLVAAVRPDLEDPPANRRAIRDLGSPDTLTPAARAQLDRLQGAARVADEVTRANDPDAYPAVLPAYDVLGSLGPSQDPSADALEPDLLADPGFDRLHDGVARPVRWVPLDRTRWRGSVDPTDVVEDAAGWTVLAARFDAPGGGPAWLEIDLGSGAGTSFEGPAGAVFAFGGSGFPRLSPTAGFAYSLNGAPSTSVSYLAREGSAVTRVPVVLRDGRNVLFVRQRSAYGSPVVISVHDPRGRPWPGLRGSHEDAPLGAAVDAAPPSGFGDAESWLRALPERGPGAEALLGLLVMLDRRPAEGMARLESALERAEGRPEATGLAALLSGVVAQTSYLPEAWRRARARDLAERVLTEDPDHLPMGLAMADVLVREDRDEEALLELERLGRVHPGQVRSLVESAMVFLRLGLEARAEALLAEAVDRAPRSPVALTALAYRMARYSSDRLAAPLRDRSRLAAGISPQRLEQVAREVAQAGEVGLARQAWRDALLRSPDRDRRYRYADWLVDLGDLDAAEDELTALTEEFPDWTRPYARLAEVALRRGDRAAERRARLRVVALDPSDRAARERLEELGVADPLAELRDRFLLGSDEVLDGYDGAGRDDSVVRVLDQACVKLYPDGSGETVTHEIVQVRDLEACEREGELRLRGDVLRVATVEQGTGREYEPVRVAGSYVMPQLEPGDFVERITRTRSSGASLVVRPGRWYFRSISEPFVISRYVVSVPKSLDLRLATHGEVDTHEQYDLGDDVVHVFESREQPRVLEEPGRPPVDWFLPWVELGMDEPTDARADVYRAQLLPFVEVTPEVARAARETTAAAGGQEEAARVLHDLVNETLVQRSAGPVQAVEALLSRSGNPVLLYAALLDAVGIAHDIVWSRDVPPAGDPEPDPPFAELSRVQRDLLVVVRPDDGPVAWCSMDSRTQPYGRLPGDAPGAEAWLVRAGAPTSLPDAGEIERPGTHIRLDLDVALDGAARVSGEVAFAAAPGFFLEAQVREAPEVLHRNFVESIAANVLPGLELEDYSIAGLDDDERLAFRFDGRAPRFLDAGGGCPLPVPRLQLLQALAIEGERTLPYLQDGVQLDEVSVLVRLANGLRLDEPPPGVRDVVGAWSYELDVGPRGPGEWTVTRRFDSMPFSLEPSEYGSLLRFARRIDEAERAWLRFSRVEEGAATDGR